MRSTRRFNRLNETIVGECIIMYEMGASLAKIGEVVGASRQAIWELFRNRSVKMRPKLRFGPANHFWRGGVWGDALAHDEVEQALNRGDIERGSVCETCGRSGQASDGRDLIHAHHDDYSEPLKVRWLCQPCHHEWHKHNTAKPRLVGGRPAKRTAG